MLISTVSSLDINNRHVIDIYVKNSPIVYYRDVIIALEHEVMLIFKSEYDANILDVPIGHDEYEKFLSEIFSMISQLKVHVNDKCLTFIRDDIVSIGLTDDILYSIY